MTAGKTALASLLLILSVGCVEEEETCDGADLQEVIDALSAAQSAGYDCGAAFGLDFDYPKFVACIQVATTEAQERRGRMPAACQKLFDDTARKLSVGSGSASAGTQCEGDVCCDDTGCYGG